MSKSYPWSVLRISVTTDSKVIRKAYAELIKAMDLDADAEGYAGLRQARDEALRRAKHESRADDSRSASPESADSTSDQLDERATRSAAWPYAAPAVLTDRIGSLHTDLAAVLGATFGGAAPFAAKSTVNEPSLVLPCDPFSRVERYDIGSTDIKLSRRIGQSAAARLVELLEGGDVDQDCPLNSSEEGEARGCLNEIIDHATSSALPQQEAIDNWLAERLASNWPRSAPLVEHATAAFGWERDWGKIGERPAQAYLGPRLRGLRFQSRVLDPKHEFHWAWTELHRPGRVGTLARRFGRRSEINQLLAGIRANFPELESHFDPQRVASWETIPREKSRGGLPWVLLVVGGFQVLRFLGEGSGGDPPAPLPFLEDAASSTDAAKTMEPVVKEIFGQEKTADWLQLRNPDLYRALYTDVEAISRNQPGSPYIQRAPIDRVRELVYLNLEKSGDETLLDGMRVHLAILRAAQASSTSDCTFAMRSGKLKIGVALPDDEREKERYLYAKMADSGLLDSGSGRGPHSAKVPGELVTKVVRLSGLPHDRLSQALVGKGSDADRCTAKIALLAATLDDSSLGAKAQRDILLTI